MIGIENVAAPFGDTEKLLDVTIWAVADGPAATPTRSAAEDRVRINLMIGYPPVSFPGCGSTTAPWTENNWAKYHCRLLIAA